jgi:hypothetical protein
MGSELDVRWISVFADVPARRADLAQAFWSAVSGWTPGAPEGDEAEFLPLEPADGDRYLWLQRLETGEPAWHLDLHVPDLDRAQQQAASLGARPTRRDPSIAVLRTPAGQPFCLVAETVATRTRSAWAEWPQGQHSFVDQLCLDIPAERFDDEADFWATLTGWPRSDGGRAEFDRITPPATLPIKLLLQRLGGDDGVARAHVDLACDRRPVEVARHEVLGARVVGDLPWRWTVMRDPAGLTYCITDHPPH